ncbi:MAG: hypothetical protein C0601_01975 [Candidatus Muiribacterium halophilum]|uniref:NolW-like domain-containing protein n=1 Tax=Muiribacterium halophilum TaxID=2053465 RepID=A0A2N5ZKX5_MUIH1|nr:MAG: hypothetical protein C0601_01975 [Candidatus Muirbacterium halophilum]
MKRYIMILMIFVLSTGAFASLDDIVSKEYFGYKLINHLINLYDFNKVKYIVKNEDLLSRRSFASVISLIVDNIEKQYSRDGYVSVDLDHLVQIEKMILDFTNELELLYSDNISALSSKITTLEMVIAHKSKMTGLLKPQYDYSQTKTYSDVVKHVESDKKEDPQKKDIKNVIKKLEMKGAMQKVRNADMKKEKYHPDFYKRVNFSCFASPVKNVADALIENTQLNLFVSDDVDSKVTAQIKDMELIDALHNISDQSNTVVDIEGSNIYIRSKNQIVEKSFKIQHIELDEMVGFLNKIKSTNGQIITNPINNSIIVADKLKYVKKIEESIKELDKKDVGADFDTRVIILKYAEAQNVINIISNYKSETGKINANTKANSIVIMDRKRNITQMEELVKIIDIPSFESRQMTYIYSVRYGEAQSILSILQSEAFAGSAAKDLKLSSDDRTNSIILTGSDESINRTLKYIEKLDIRTRQVTIMAKIIEVTLDKSDAEGVNLNMIIPHGVKDKTESEQNKIGLNTFENLGEYSATFEYGTLAKEQVQTFVQSLENNSNAKIVSNPTITTLDNQEAKILIGEKIPFEETTTAEGSTSSTINFKDVGITLTVKPKISPDNYVTLKIHPEISQQNGTTSKGEPIIGTTEADTNVLVKNGHTLVIGGLIKTNNVKTVNSAPLLCDIPVLKRLFRSVRNTEKRIETIVLITPYIIEDYRRNSTLYMNKYSAIKEKEVEND